MLWRFSLIERQQKRNGNTAHAFRDVVWAVFFSAKSYVMVKK